MNRAKKGNLENLQLYSLATRIVTVFLGLIQTIITVRILTPREYGIVGLVVAVGAIFELVQHLGLSVASTREISTTQNGKDAFKVAFVALVVKILVSLPLVAILFFASHFVAFNLYGKPVMLTGLRLYAIILIMQGPLAVFRSLLQGLQELRKLFKLEILQACVTLSLMISLVYYFRLNGFFYGMLASTSLVLLIFMVALLPFFRSNFHLPSFKEFKLLFKNIFEIAKVGYGIKISYTTWLKTGILILGKYVTPAQLGYFNLSLNIGKKSSTLATAISRVNLPYFTKFWATEFRKFKSSFTKNFQRFSVISTFIFALLILFSRELTLLFGGSKYLPASEILPYILLSFLFYSLYNFIGSGAIFPTKNLAGVLKTFALATIGSIILIFLASVAGFGTIGAALGLLLAPVIIFIYYSKIAVKRIKIKLYTWRFLWTAVAFLPALTCGLMVKDLIFRCLVAIFCLSVYLFLLSKLNLIDFGVWFKKATKYVKL